MLGKLPSQRSDSCYRAHSLVRLGVVPVHAPTCLLVVHLELLFLSWALVSTSVIVLSRRSGQTCPFHVFPPCCDYVLSVTSLRSLIDSCSVELGLDVRHNKGRTFVAILLLIIHHRCFALVHFRRNYMRPTSIVTLMNACQGPDLIFSNYFVMREGRTEKKMMCSHINDPCFRDSFSVFAVSSTLMVKPLQKIIQQYVKIIRRVCS